MKIEAVDLFFLQMPDRDPAHKLVKDMLLVRVRAGQYEGWGECEAAPFVSLAACETALKWGSESLLVQSMSMVHAAPRRRARSRSSLARPYICLLIILSLVIWPSVWPFDQGSAIAARTAS